MDKFKSIRSRQNKARVIFLLVVIFLSGCIQVKSEDAATPTPFLITATLPPTNTPQPTQTAFPPTSIPTITPIEATTTSQVNVRADTSTASQSYGTIAAFSKVQIIGKDATGKWFKIIFSSSPTGDGWIRADYVQVDSSAEIPALDAGTSGVVIRGVNVRSGPGKDYESLGLLSENDVLTILGKDSSGTWFKVEYPTSPNGTGWIAAEYLQVDNADLIPVIAEEVSPTETPPPAATVESASSKTAIADGDSADSPSAAFQLKSTAARTVQVRGEISAPQGDLEDWFAFSSERAEVTISVACDSESLQLELWQASTLVQSFPSACEHIFSIDIQPNENYLLSVSVAGNNSVYIQYQLKLETNR